jgi:cathepsin B
MLTLSAASISTALLTQKQIADVAYAEKNRLEIISKINGDPKSAWIAETPIRFKGKSYEQFLRDGAGVLGGNPTENAARLQIKTHEELIAKTGIQPKDIPAEFNTYTKWGGICPIMAKIQDQSACGSCYAVSAASAATDRFCIAKNGTESPRLSEVDLMSCCFTCKGANGGCFGGTPSHCWDYMTQQGIAGGGGYDDFSECLEYPFPKCSHHINGTYPACPAKTYTSPTCFWKCDPKSKSKMTFDQSQAAHKFGTSYKIDASVKAIQTDLMAHGPVQASMFLTSDFETYRSGVFTTSSKDYIGAHAVKITGWGVDINSSLPYWLVQNSWNREWGEDGYFRIERGTH